MGGKRSSCTGAAPVPGAVVLVGGDPGIGKSTLLLQLLAQWSEKGMHCLYVSGEESIMQTKLRADRILKKASATLFIVNQIDLNVVIEFVNKLEPDVVIIDSVQVIYQSGMGKLWNQR